ncbi:MAG: winged helix-turn-helix transcriptional regulator [Planctomycetes bacterium]|nr:winged helix-turn-helix transcriptional regulator [Planctomycetota bacterium]
MVNSARTDPDTVLRAFAEPTRLSLLVLLSAGEVCVCDLVSALALPQPTISRHLGVLRRAGMVEARRVGTWMWYRLSPAGCGLHIKLLACLPACREELPGLGRAARKCDQLRSGRTCC